MNDTFASSGYLLMPPNVRRKFRSYATLISCTPIGAIDALSAAINGMQSGTRASDLWQDAPDLSAYPSVRMTGLGEWSIETILRDVLAYGGLFGSRNFRTWNNIAEATNKLNALENELWPPAGEDLIWYELFRIGHRQFDWQVSPSARDFARYLSIYGYAPLQKIIVDEFGLCFEDIFRLCFILADSFKNKKAIRTPIDFGPLGIDGGIAGRFLDRFTTTLPDASQDARDNSLLDADFAYRPSPFRVKPMVRLVPDEADTHIYCPVHRFLFDRLTDGLYYDLVTRKDFANPYGRGFQAYAEKVCREILCAGYSVLPEQAYGSASKRVDSIDIIVSDESADLFIECKSRRVSLRGKTNLGDGETSISEMDKLIEGIVQSYKSIDDALQGRFPHWKPRSKPSYLLLTYTKAWYINSPKLREYIDRTTAKRLEAAGVSPGIMQEAPLTICSIGELESLCATLCDVPIDRLFAQKVEHAFAGWELETYIRDQFPESTRRQKARLAHLAEPALKALSFMDR